MNHDKPQYITALETSYGTPSQAGFGSAVFFEQINPADKLDEAALKKYKYFTGELWERYGEDAWMGSWKKVYERPAIIERDIIAELRSIKDQDTAISIPMILDNIEGADKARVALASVFNEPRINDLQVFNLGDGGAMSGLLIAGRNNDNGVDIFLVFLYD